jgi:hypothetical protein
MSRLSGGAVAFRTLSHFTVMKFYLLAGMVVLPVAGCVGSIGGDAGPKPNPGTDPSPGNTGQAPGGMQPGMQPPALIPSVPGQTGGCQEASPPVQPARRLTRDQYLATVRDLLGDNRDLGDRLPADDKGEAVFAPPDTLTVTPAWADKLLTSAEDLAKTAMANLPALLPCNPAGAEEACAAEFIKAFGKRAFRRPLTPDDVAGLTAVYKAGASDGGFNGGIELVISTILQSPSFVYRIELGQNQGSLPGAVKLSPYEVAARLSYFLWGTMPDRALFEAADRGELATAESINAQVERLLKDPRARSTLVGFTQRLFGTDILDDANKDPEIYPEFDDALRESMKAEFRAFVEDALFAGDGRLQTLLTSPASFVDAPLARLYGVPAPAGSGLQKVQLPAAQRAGVLTSVGLLAAHTINDTSAPIIRGKFIRERLLCAELAEPPPGLDVVAPEPKPGSTTRELLERHSVDPSCTGCHNLMDPIGFGYGNFDGLGRWRQSEEGKPVDSSGRLQATDVDGAFRGPVELAEKLAASQQVRDCVTTTMLNFVQGPQAAGDVCLTGRLRRSFDEARHDLRALIRAIAQSDGFQYRRQLQGEVIP